MKEIIQKTRLLIDRQHIGKDICIRFTDPDSKSTYQYPHDALIDLLKEKAPSIFDTDSWRMNGYYNWPKIPREEGKSKYRFLRGFLSHYQIEIPNSNSSTIEEKKESESFKLVPPAEHLRSIKEWWDAWRADKVRGALNELVIHSCFWRIVAYLHNTPWKIQRLPGGFYLKLRNSNLTIPDSEVSELGLSDTIFGIVFSVTTDKSTHKLLGVDPQQAQDFYQDVRIRWIESSRKILDEWLLKYQGSINFVESLKNPLRYTRQSKTDQHRLTLLKSLPVPLPPELKEHEVQKKHCALQQFLSNPAQLVAKANQIFVKQEKSRNAALFETIESNPLSDEQQTAVVTDEDHNLIVAAAGSGKTSVIVAKLAHLLAQGDINPSQILILAFNRAARDELHKRIVEKIKHPSREEASVKTFHGLGCLIIGNVTNRKPSVANHASETSESAQYIRPIIEDLRSDKDFEQTLLKWFAWHLHQYKSAFEFESLGEYYEYLEGNNIVTLKGEKVKSYEECMIANFLHLNGVHYEYEANYEFDTADARHRRYQPDFFLPNHKIYIEHFGVDREGRTAPFVDEHEYRQSMAWKRELHCEHETDLVETYSYQQQEGHLIPSLRQELKAREVTLIPVSAKERLDELRKTVYDRFSKLISVFLGHFKSNDFDKSTILDRATHFSDTKRANAFTNVFWPIYEKYETNLRSANEVDFESMIRDATVMVKDGSFQSRYRYLLVDEFQDISVSRANLIKALCAQNIENQLFAVGDDWQSIYRFAGSDISVMRHFDRYFGATARSDLSTTYRCNQEIVNLSSKFIASNPDQLSKQVLSVRERNRSAVYIGRPSADITDTLEESLRRIQQEVQGANVLVLGRYKHNRPDNWKYLNDKFESLTLKFHTIHGAKGLEADCVVIIGLSAGTYGFPSQIEDDPLLDLVLTKQEFFPHAEERRLFYVAMTRAKNAVYMLAPETKPSTFVEELEESGYSIEHFGADPALRAHCPTCKTSLLSLRSGTNGKFAGCANYPRCTYTADPCPLCHSGIIIIDNRRGRCEACKGEVELCLRCSNGYLRMRTGKFGDFWGCSSYPTCRYTRPVSPELCPRCFDGYLVVRTGKSGDFWGCSSYPTCRYTRPKSTD